MCLIMMRAWTGTFYTPAYSLQSAVMISFYFHENF